MRFLIVCEGDAETWDSWSGCTRSLVDHLRDNGHSVSCIDADLYGLDRLMAAALSFSPNRGRWGVRFHLGPAGFRARSRKASRLMRDHSGAVDAVIQIGATFQINPPEGIPHVLYCDSNFQLAAEGAASGFSDAARVTPSESVEVRARETRVYQDVDRIYTFSERVRQSFIEGFEVSGDRVEAVFAGPNFEVGKWPEVAEWQPGGEPVVLFVGRAFHRKGGDLLIEAFKIARAKIPDAKLLIIGPDEAPPELADSPEGVTNLGFLDRATPAGEQAVLDAYEQARVFCLPTRYEPFGVAYLEAMHFELPCIGPKAWAVPEIIEHGVTGFLVEPEDPNAIADALVEILSDENKAREMGLAGADRMRSSFTWGHVARRMADSVEALRQS